MRKIFEMISPQKEQEIRNGQILLEGKLYPEKDIHIKTCFLTGLKFHDRYTNKLITQCITRLSISRKVAKNLFKNDDTIKSFTIISINRIQDSVNISFQIESRLGDIEKISLTA